MVFGASGPIGQALIARAGARLAVATYCGRPFTGGRPFDVAKSAIADLPVDWSAVKAAFVLAGRANPDWCAANPDSSRLVNVDGISRLADGLAARGVKVVFASSEAVYGGSGPHGEDEMENPPTTYGRHKLEAETYIRRTTPDHLIARISRAVGTIRNDGTLVTDLYRRLLEGGEVTLAQDQIFSPILLEELAEALLRLVDGGAAGVFNLGGPQPVSRVGLASLLTAAMPDGGAAAKVRAVPFSTFQTLESRTLDTSLNIARVAAATGMDFATPAQICEAIVARGRAA